MRLARRLPAAGTAMQQPLEVVAVVGAAAGAVVVVAAGTAAAAAVATAAARAAAAVAAAVAATPATPWACRQAMLLRLPVVVRDHHSAGP